jgi:hypothetical protein
MPAITLCWHSIALEQAGLDGIGQIGRADTFHRGADRIDILEIADNDLCALFLERRRPIVPAMDHRPDIEAARDRLPDGGTAGLAAGAGDQYCAGHHGSIAPKAKTCRETWRAEDVCDQSSLPNKPQGPSYRLRDPLVFHISVAGFPILRFS